MRGESVPYGHIRRLTRGENSIYAEHLKRLGPESRRRRFAHAASPAFAEEHARRALAQSLVFGWFEAGRLGAAAELAPLSGGWREAEAALSVEAQHRRRGIGGRLLRNVLRAAGNRGVRRLHILYHADNEAMNRLLAPHMSMRRHAAGQVHASLVPPAPHPASLLREAVESGEATFVALMEGAGRPAAA